MTALLLSLVLLGQAPAPPTIRVIDLDAGEPHHLIVIIDGEPWKATSVPLGVGPSPTPTPTPVPPGPVPPPAPTPDPTPVVPGALWVTYITPAKPVEADSGPVGYPALTALVKPGSVEWRYQASGDAEIARRKFQDYAKDAPVTVFQDSTGKVLSTLKGNDPAAIVGKIKSYKGEK